MPDEKTTTPRKSSRGCADILNMALSLTVLALIIFQFVRIPFRTTKGIRVEFEQDYRCVNMRGKVYWLDPEEAESVLKLKHKAPKDRCEIYAPRWHDPAVCLTHRLEHRVGYEGTLGWLLNY